MLSLLKKQKMHKKKDKKTSLPRKFGIKKCIQQPIKGYTMKSSCAPFICAKNIHLKQAKEKSQKIQFLYNPNNPKKVLMFILIKT